MLNFLKLTIETNVSFSTALSKYFFENAFLLDKCTTKIHVRDQLSRSTRSGCDLWILLNLVQLLPYSSSKSNIFLSIYLELTIFSFNWHDLLRAYGSPYYLIFLVNGSSTSSNHYVQDMAQMMSDANEVNQQPKLNNTSQLTQTWWMPNSICKGRIVPSTGTG